jgi:hypothetical protein
LAVAKQRLDLEQARSRTINLETSIMPASTMADQQGRFTAINDSATLNGRPSSAQEEVDDNQAIEGLDQAQIDAILAIANAGDEDDEDEDGAEAENGATNDAKVEEEDEASQDTEMSEALQRMISQLVAQHSNGTTSEQLNGHEPSDPYAPVITSVSDPYGRARNSAAALSSLLSDSGVPINTIIPAIQGRISSHPPRQSPQQYRPRPSTRKKVTTAYIESWGSPAEFNSRLLAQPNAYSRPLNGALASSQSTKSVLEKSTRRPLDSETIKSFGQPPLGGSLLGSPRRISSQPNDLDQTHES